MLLLGLVFKLVIVDPMLKHGVLPLVISTIALSLFLKESVKNFYSSQAQPFPSLVPVDRHHVFGAVDLDPKPRRARRRDRHRGGAASLPQQDAARPSMQATAQNPALARILGIPVRADGALHLPASTPCSSRIASILISPIYLAKFINGETLGIAAFLAAIIGGFNQVRGAILGGVILGVLENLSAAYISSQYRGAFPLLILIAVILWRPQGLLGRVEERTV